MYGNGGIGRHVWFRPICFVHESSSLSSRTNYLRVAQFGSASDLGSEGRGFKSHLVDHLCRCDAMVAYLLAKQEVESSNLFIYSICIIGVVAT